MCHAPATLTLVLHVAASAHAGQAAPSAWDALRASCDAGRADSRQACLALAHRYFEGVGGVERSVARARELATKACTVVSPRQRSVEEIAAAEQACFTGFLWGAETAWVLGGNRWGWEFVRDITVAPGLEDRLRMIAGWRTPAYLYYFLHPTFDEIKALPDLPEVQKAVRARIVEIAHSDPDPAKRSYCAEVYDYVVGFKGLEEMARSDPDPEVRRVAARARLQPELQIAARAGDSATVLKVEDPEARRHGVEMLNDQAGLATAAQSDPDASVRAAAVRGLQDQALLARIAEKDKDEGVRLSAAAAVKDVAVLERWAEKSRDTDVRQMAVERISNQAVLARIAERDPEYLVREQAIKRLTDQVVLKRIATSRATGLRRGELRDLEASALRGTAVERLSDQKLLFDLATKDADENVYLAAIGALKDQKLLLEVATRRPGEKVARAVAEGLTDQALLRTFLESQPDSVARVTAAGHISDPALAMSVARGDPDDAVRRMAVSKIADPSLLLQIARSDAPPAARVEAVSRLTDRKVLLDLEQTSPYPDVRVAVAGKLVRDPAEAVRYARTSQVAGIRRLAAEVVTDQELLKELATKDPDVEVRMAAIRRLTNVAVVAEIARTAVRTNERATAEIRLAELTRR
jgi:hypothetical protein